MQAYVEHANITVHDLDEAIRFLTTALPEFRVRGGGDSAEKRWAHVGTDNSYIALQQQIPTTDPQRQLYTTLGVNHIGLVVEDADAVYQRLVDAGYRPAAFQSEPHPHRKRRYIFDKSGHEWEFVQYLSDIPAERNDYTQ